MANEPTISDNEVTNTINVKLKQRIDTENNWSSKNPVLLKGEQGLVEGSSKYKIGDGTTDWNSLPYYQGMSSTEKTKLDGIESGATAVTDSIVSGWGYKKTDTNTWIALKGATTSAAGTAGYAPAPAAGAANRYLRSDGTWAIPPDNNTTYSNMGAATVSAAGKAGLVPAPAAGKQASFLRGDGTWVVPTNTTYSAVSTSANGLMTADDKKRVDVLKKPIATCATGRATAAKVATLSNFVLTVGTTIAVKFTDTAGTANPTSGNLTLNVNGTGAKNIGYFRNGSKSALTYANGSFFYNNLTHIFTYDGSYWLCMDWNADNNTTYTMMTTTEFEALFN